MSGCNDSPSFLLYIKTYSDFHPKSFSITLSTLHLLFIYSTTTITTYSTIYKMQFSIISALLAATPAMATSFVLFNNCEGDIIISPTHTNGLPDPRILRHRERFEVKYSSASRLTNSFTVQPKDPKAGEEGHVYVTHSFSGKEDKFSFDASAIFGNPFTGSRTGLRVQYGSPPPPTQSRARGLAVKNNDEDGLCRNLYLTGTKQDRALFITCDTNSGTPPTDFP